MIYRAIANPAVYHCGNRWAVADERYTIISVHSSKDAAEQEAGRLNQKEMEEKRNTPAISKNQAYCKAVADDLEAISAGTLYRCDNCGEQYNLEDATESEEGGHICSHCGTEIDEPEPVSMLDFLNDCYNIEYRVDSHGKYKSVEIMVACGGPNIYINTKTAAVELYWWTETARWDISREVANEIDYVFEELWACR